jgi:hypothetical protein
MKPLQYELQMVGDGQGMYKVRLARINSDETLEKFITISEWNWYD